MTKIVYNRCFGVFSLSDAGVRRYCELKALHYKLKGKEYFNSHNILRTDPILVQVVEELGEKANGRCADLAIRELPAGTLYRIEEHDGKESVWTFEEYEWSTAQ